MTLPEYETREALCTRVQMTTYPLRDWKVWTEDDLPRILGWLKRGQEDLAELIELLEQGGVEEKTLKPWK